MDGAARSTVTAAFPEVVRRLGLMVRACAIMRDHVHVVVMRSRHRIEYIVNQLKGGATRALGLKRTPWTRGGWKVFLNDEAALGAAVEYVEANPPAAGLPPQCWDFVTLLPAGCRSCCNSRTANGLDRGRALPAIVPIHRDDGGRPRLNTARRARDA